VSHGFRRALALLLILGLLGSLLELMLFGHHEDLLQTIPLALIGVALVASAALSFRPGRGTIRAFRFAMALLIAGGLLGVGLHLRANLEFQTEIDPTLHGWTLVSKALHAKAPPALAPGMLAQLGLLGFILAQGHTVRQAATSDSIQETLR
jgi:hypothetical protein